MGYTTALEIIDVVPQPIEKYNQTQITSPSNSKTNNQSDSLDPFLIPTYQAPNIITALSC